MHKTNDEDVMPEITNQQDEGGLLSETWKIWRIKHFFKYKKDISKSSSAFYYNL